MNLTKSESNFLKGIALSLMLLHHLFGFPERIIDPQSVIYLFKNIQIEEYLGLFGKICVPMFLFLSGYGFSRGGAREWRYYAAKIVSFYKLYWIVFFIFVPIGLFFFKDNIRYDFDIKIFFESLMGLSSSYNEEWWFVESYLLLVFLMPLINFLRKRLVLLLFVSFTLFVISQVMKIYNVNTAVISLQALLYWQLIFIVGYVNGCYQESKWVRKFSLYCSDKRKVFMLLLLIAIPFSIFFSRGIGFILLTPLFVFVCVEYKSLLPNFIYKVIISIGQYSMFMWLTHTFYAYYFTHKLIYAPKYTILIFLNLLIISFVTSWLLTKISKIPLTREKYKQVLS